MIDSIGKSKKYSQKVNTPNVDTLLKLSLGLILFTVISTALIYAETMPVVVDGTSYDVEYTATEMSVSGIDADLDFISLLLSVDVSNDNDGVLNITFERSFFDAVFDDGDDDFIILVDGVELIFTETNTTPQSRTLSIGLPSGTEEVEIIGSVFGNSVEAIPPEPEPVVEPPTDTPTDASDDTLTNTPTDEPAELPIDTPTDDTTEPPTELPTDEPAELPIDTPTDTTEPPIDTPTDTPIDTPPNEPTSDSPCGTGTVLKDGECVLESTSPTSFKFVKGIGEEFAFGFIAAFVVAGIVGAILAIVSKANKSS